MIAATGKWETDQAVDYAKFASDLGADALQVTLPALDDDQMIEHFASITSVTPVGIVLHGDPPMPLISRLLEMESVVAFKEEYNTIYSLQLYRSFGKRITLFAGGEKAQAADLLPVRHESLVQHLHDVRSFGRDPVLECHPGGRSQASG